MYLRNDVENCDTYISFLVQFECSVVECNIKKFFDLKTGFYVCKIKWTLQSRVTHFIVTEIWSMKNIMKMF